MRCKGRSSSAGPRARRRPPPENSAAGSGGGRSSGTDPRAEAIVGSTSSRPYRQSLEAAFGKIPDDRFEACKTGISRVLEEIVARRSRGYGTGPWDARGTRLPVQWGHGLAGVEMVPGRGIHRVASFDSGLDAWVSRVH